MESNTTQSEYTPLFFDLSSKQGHDAFLTFRERHPHVYFIDTFGEQIHELELVRDPKQISHTSLDPKIKKEVTTYKGVWVYFPWKKIAVKIFSRDIYNELRLSRNKNLITIDEEKILEKKYIAIAGLNVGNPGAVCLALEGIGSTFKLADFDPLSVSNLNRFRAGLTDLMVNKAVISARQMSEINPYLTIEVYEQGLTLENTSTFLNDPKVDILIEEMDNLKLKISARESAKKNRIPVLMVTGNSENVIVDVERYDIEPDLPILAGYLSNELVDRINSIKPGEGTYQERIELARDFMGIQYLDSRLISSFSEVGKRIAGIPQLAESSFLRGAVLTHFTKHILLGHNIVSGRYSITLSGIKFKPHDKTN
jgi:molybdopterin/thiamine biosynthesis adenylyltransferase